MASTMHLNGSRTVLQRSGHSGFVAPVLRSVKPDRSGARVHAAANKHPLHLNTPKRLWETGSELWFHGYQPPEYLDGSLPGDRGFDPLHLGAITPGMPGVTEENKLEWLFEGELYNGRVAMLAAAGILLTDWLGKGPWWATWQGDYAPLIPDKYWSVVAVGHLVFGYFEWNRFRNWKNKGQTGLGPFAPFDPLGLTNDYRRQSEVRNGRLAMLANLGFWCQAATTGKGPIENLKEHLADPTHANILTQGERGWFIFATFLWTALLVNVLGFAYSREDAKVRTVFSQFE